MTRMAADKITWRKTHCSRMDHGGCALLVGVRDNKIVKVKGDPDGYLNQGYICPKAIFAPDHLNYPSRLRYPLERDGKRGSGKWKRISWTHALNKISEQFLSIKEEYGAKAVAFCQGMPKGMEHFVLIRLANVFGSPNVVAVQDVCHAPREISGIHTCGFYPVADLHDSSRLVVLWGSNITSTNEEGQICSLLTKQLKKNTELMVIDPVKIPLAEKARYWLRPKPGTDHALALAFLNVIIEEELYDQNFVENWTFGFDDLTAHVKAYTPEKMSAVVGISADLIRESAGFYAASRPAAIQWGNAIEQNMFAFHTIRALLCLMAICGNLDVPGGNIQANEPEILSLGKFVRADLLPSKRKEMIHAGHNTIPGLMTVPPAYFKKAILKSIPYPLKGAYIQCANPLMAYANSRETHDALMALDFLVVSDIVMTPTASLADIVLPAATQFEFNDIGHYGLGHGLILARPKVVDPPGECRPDIQILNELGRLMTSGEFWYENHEDLLDEVVAPSGMNYDQFTRQGVLKGDRRFRKYLNSGFKTPTNKVELSLSRAKQFDLPIFPEFAGPLEENDPEYPLILTSSKNRLYLHSSYRWVESLRRRSKEPVVEIHPRTAEEYDVSKKQTLVIETRYGSITQSVCVTKKVPPGVVHAAYGWWFPESDPEKQYEWEKSNYNILTGTDRLGKEFGTPNLKGIGCRIRKE